jgi:hypothetical protein
MAPSLAVSLSVCLAVSRHRAVGSRSLSVSFCHPLPHVSHSSADTRAETGLRLLLDFLERSPI